MVFEGKMEPTPYLKWHIRQLNKDLRKLPRTEKLEALRKYKIGLEYSFWNNHGDRFPKPSVDFEVIRELYHEHFFEKGNYVGWQLGPLEVESAREFLLAEIEKRKQKFSQSGFLENLWGHIRRK